MDEAPSDTGDEQGVVDFELDRVVKLSAARSEHGV